MVKNPFAGNEPLIPGLGRSYGKGNGNPLQFLAWIVPWTEEPAGLQSVESQWVRHYLATEHAYSVHAE